MYYCGESTLFIATVVTQLPLKTEPLSQLLTTQDAKALLCRLQAPIMLALCSMLSHTHCAQFHAGVIAAWPIQCAIVKLFASGINYTIHVPVICVHVPVDSS